MGINRNLVIVSFLAIALMAAGDVGEVVYTYDNAQRLATLRTRTTSPACRTYSYDQTGNILHASTDATGISVTSTWGTGVMGCFEWKQTDSGR